MIVHYPETTEMRRELSERAAAVHAQTVIEHIKSLACPAQQKAALIDEIGRIRQRGDTDAL